MPWDTASRATWQAQTIRGIGTAVTVLVVFSLGMLLSHLPRYQNLSEGDKKEKP